MTRSHLSRSTLTLLSTLTLVPLILSAATSFRSDIPIPSLMTGHAPVMSIGDSLGRA